MDLLKGLTDELKSFAPLPVIGTPQDELLNLILSRVEQHLNSPLRVYASSTPDENLNIGSNRHELGDGAARVVSPGDTLPTYDDTTVSMQDGAVVGDGVLLDGGAFALPAGTVGQYRRLALVYRIADNVVDTKFSAEAASVGALADPATLYAALDGDPIAFVDLECTNVTGKYKTAGSASDVVENKVGSESRIFRIAVSGGRSGAGGSGQINWLALPGNAPIVTLEDGVEVALFEAAGDSEYSAFLVVPEDHTPSKQIFMNISAYSPATADGFLLKTVSYLIRKDTDSLASVANSHPSGNSELTNSATTKAIRQVSLPLTDASGKINSVAVNPGDVLKVVLSRDVADSDSESTRFVRFLTEVKF